MIEKIIEKLDNKNIAILGFGREGESTYDFIRKYKKELPLTILDKKKELEKNEKLRKDAFVSLTLGDKYLENLEQFDMIIKSPGISLKNISIEKIKEKLTSQIELLLEVNKKNCIGITGTKGKSTTTSLIYEIIKAQNKNVILAGNIGIPIFSILEACNKDTIFVIEMSSHQLEYLTVSPHIGVVLNLYQDHLDHAGTVEYYHHIKLNMFRNQNREDIMVYNYDNDALKNLVNQENFQSQVFSVSRKETKETDVYKKGNWIYFHESPLYNLESNRNLLGMHNLENIIIALLVSEILKLNNNRAIKTIEEFKALSYRLEKVGTINGVDYYIDTLATIPEATEDAIETLEKVSTLIFGGLDRGISYAQFISYLNNANIKNFICMPTTGYKIGKQLKKENVYFVETLKEAVKLAKKVTPTNTICLLSPAASSYEQFKNYQEKGDKFKEYVLEVPLRNEFDNHKA